MFAEHRQDYPSDTAVAEAVARKLGVGRETARRWLVQAVINVGSRPGTTSDEHAEPERLKAENRKLKGGHREILKAASLSSCQCESEGCRPGFAPFFAAWSVPMACPRCRPRSVSRPSRVCGLIGVCSRIAFMLG